MRDASAAATARSRTTLGLVLIAVGVVFTLDSAGLLRNGGRWWPLLLIGIGIVKVRQPRESGQRAAGVAFLLLGGLFQLTSILTFTSFWTLLMIGFGAFLLWQAAQGPQAEATAISDLPYLADMTLIGHVKRSQYSSDFRGGDITAVMGGIELDLRKAVLSTGSAFIDVVAFWGGVEIKVPREWTVDARIVPIMGAFENKVDPVSTPGAPRLVVRGHAIMGAVVIGH